MYKRREGKCGKGGKERKEEKKKKGKKERNDHGVLSHPISDLVLSSDAEGRIRKRERKKEKRETRLYSYV